MRRQRKRTEQKGAKRQMPNPSAIPSEGGEVDPDAQPEVTPDLMRAAMNLRPAKNEEAPASEAGQDGKTPTPSASGKSEDESSSAIVVPPELLGKKTEPKAPEDPSEGIDPEKMSGKTKAAFIHLRTQAKRATELEAEIAKLKAASPSAQPVDAARLTDLEKQNADLADRLSRVSLEHDPRFRAKYDSRLQRLLGQIQTIGKEMEISPLKLQTLVSSPIKERLKMLSDDGLSEVAPALYTILSQVDEVATERAQELEKHRETRSRQEGEEKEAIKKLRVETFDEQLRAAIKDGHVVYREVPGNEPWNKSVQALTKQAREIFDDGEPKALTSAIIAGVAAPIYKKLWLETQEEVEKLRASLKKVRGISPELGGGKGESDRGADASALKGKPRTPAEIAAHIAAQTKAAFSEQ